MKRPQLLSDEDMRIEVEKKIFGIPLVDYAKSKAFWRFMKHLSKGQK